MRERRPVYMYIHISVSEHSVLFTHLDFFVLTALQYCTLEKNHLEIFTQTPWSFFFVHASEAKIASHCATCKTRSKKLILCRRFSLEERKRKHKKLFAQTPPWSFLFVHALRGKMALHCATYRTKSKKTHFMLVTNSSRSSEEFSRLRLFVSLFCWLREDFFPGRQNPFRNPLGQWAFIDHLVFTKESASIQVGPALSEQINKASKIFWLRQISNQVCSLTHERYKFDFQKTSN